MSSAEVDVLVVGAGPTGLTAAGDLARAGRSVTVLERRPTMNPGSRAFATMARTLEVLDARGLADGLLTRAHRAPSVTIFGGARIDLTHLDSRYPFAMVTPQANVDRALEHYAVAHGARIRRGVDVVGLAQDADGVIVTGCDPQGRRTRWRAAYVIGADGAHSGVRRMTGIDFPGRTLLSSIVLADVKLADGPTGEGLALHSTPDVFAFLAPYDRRDADGAWFRAMVWDRARQLPDHAPADRMEIIGVLRRAMGADPGVVDVGWASRFHCDERQVPQYRRGRVFLAGDAAHVHSPMGGQGMNTGIQDAANLAWKVDAALGGAPDAVLDTYHDERHPIGQRVLMQSGMMARGITLRPRGMRAVRNLFAPRLLRIPTVRDAVAGGFAGTTLRYPHAAGESALVGTRATQVPLVGCRLTELQRTPGFVLAGERGTQPVVAENVLHAERSDGGPAVLIRPDGYIAWAGRSADRSAWQGMLGKWTGAGAQPAALGLIGGQVPPGSAVNS
ncbi:FAD-dependent monooxygenase [Mycolicibacterium sp. S2-37]|uniref:FAD-dependent oxidoreductase n=1 Tax=Mycolicibacterium sp. S2-37 TaxID=2810297 RepID=UPI001A951D40|nr:FAD-dependent oxidoreductase [Mycolicibacterium sp. S2-37]MBO0678688.1 FAD-dependent monooxygenase [Mycolicibacterium sp. S2-37]